MIFLDVHYMQYLDSKVTVPQKRGFSGAGDRYDPSSWSWRNQWFTGVLQVLHLRKPPYRSILRSIGLVTSGIFSCSIHWYLLFASVCLRPNCLHQKNHSRNLPTWPWYRHPPLLGHSWLGPLQSLQQSPPTCPKSCFRGAPTASHSSHQHQRFVLGQNKYQTTDLYSEGWGFLWMFQQTERCTLC